MPRRLRSKKGAGPGAPGRSEIVPVRTPGEQPGASVWRAAGRGWYSPPMDKDKTTGMKSAYELALERLESRGIERPSEDALTDEVRERMAEARRKAEAKAAELEILHRDRLAKLADPAEREQEEKEFRHERGRIEDRRDAEIERVRSG